MNSGAPNPLTLQIDGDHYKNLKIQPIEYNHANGIPFAEGNVIKYMTRWRSKGGLKDLAKAKHIIELLIELETRGTENVKCDTNLPASSIPAANRIPKPHPPVPQHDGYFADMRAQVSARQAVDNRRTEGRD